MGMDATELARWTRFAAKGGIGKCVAICDCVAESAEDLMFLKDDEITVLMQLPENTGLFLGHCEGVVGRFHGIHVKFLTKLKKPVMTKRTSVSGKSPTPSSASTTASLNQYHQSMSSTGGPPGSSASSVRSNSSPPGSRRGSLSARKETDSLSRQSSSRRPSLMSQNYIGSSDEERVLSHPYPHPTYHDSASIINTSSSSTSTSSPARAPSFKIQQAQLQQQPHRSSPQSSLRNRTTPSPAASRYSPPPPLERSSPPLPPPSIFTQAHPLSNSPSPISSTPPPPRALDDPETIPEPAPAVPKNIPFTRRSGSGSGSPITTGRLSQSPHRMIRAPPSPAPQLSPPTSPRVLNRFTPSPAARTSPPTSPLGNTMRFTPSPAGRSSVGLKDAQTPPPILATPPPPPTPAPPTLFPTRSPPLPLQLTNSSLLHPAPTTPLQIVKRSPSRGNDFPPASVPPTAYTGVSQIAPSAPSLSTTSAAVSSSNHIVNSSISSDESVYLPQQSDDAHHRQPVSSSASTPLYSSQPNTTLSSSTSSYLSPSTPRYTDRLSEGDGDGAMGIGLSLLQNLLDGESSDEERERGSDEEERGRGSDGDEEQEGSGREKSHVTLDRSSGSVSRDIPRNRGTTQEQERERIRNINTRDQNFHDDDRDSGTTLDSPIYADFPPVPPTSEVQHEQLMQQIRLSTSSGGGSIIGGGGGGGSVSPRFGSFGSVKSFGMAAATSTPPTRTGVFATQQQLSPKSITSFPRYSPTSPSFQVSNLPSPSQPPPPLSPAPHSPPIALTPTSPSFSPRRPSYASTSTGSWDGAADIYDDYRYSVGSKSSIGSRAGGGTGGGGEEVVPPVPDARPSLHSRRSVDSYRSGLSTRAGKGDGRAAMDDIAEHDGRSSRTEADDEEQRERQDPGTWDRWKSNIVASSEAPAASSGPHALHDRSMSIESEASVYTQSSSHSHTSTAQYLTVSGTPSSSIVSPPANNSNRPPPLDLFHPQPSPLLHNAFASPLSSNGSMGSAAFTATPATFFAIEGSIPLGTAPAGHPGPSNSVEAGLAPAGGFASAMRQRIETDRTSGDSRTEGRKEEDDLPEGHGLGRRIVVEDEDEPPSRVLDESSSRDLHGSPEPPSSSPEPEHLQLKLGALVVANRTPSPSTEGAGTDEGRSKGEGSEQADFFPAAVVSASPPTKSIPPSSESVLPVEPVSSEVGISPPRPSHPDLRRGSLQVPGDAGVGSQRRSLFLPHPNAPKAPSAPVASIPPPQVAQVPHVDQQQQHPHSGPPRPDVIGIIQKALSTPRPPIVVPGRPPVVRGPTIYGRTEVDLAASVGPVPIAFSVDPPSTATAPPPKNGSVQQPQRRPSAPAQSMAPVHRSVALPTNPKVEAGSSAIPTVEGEALTQGAIPRANFHPRAPGLRPRSRSFSGFQSTSSDVPVTPRRSREEGSKPLDILSADDSKASLSSARSPSSPSLLPAGGRMSSKPSPLRPSPLSLSQNTLIGGGLKHGLPAVRTPTSPLAHSITASRESQGPSLPASPAISNFINRPLQHISSRSTLNEPPSPRQPPVSRSTLLSSTTNDGGSMTSGSSGSGTQSRSAQSTNREQPDPDTASVHSVQSQGFSPPPHLLRQPSLRTKLSLPNLRRKRSRQDETSSINSQGAADVDTLQVQDMDFELVRPNMTRFEPARASQDSGVLGKEELGSDMGHGALHSESPLLGGEKAMGYSGPQSPTVDGSTTAPWNMASSQPASAPSSRPTTDSESSMDAHRQREQKWMTIISSSPPSQARKNKKVSKLLLEGVPSSVRYLVWSHLTDGKAKVVPGVYGQLVSRGRVPASAEIERDIQSCLRDQPHLHTVQSSVVSLLQAYLNMVPDIHYSRGLTLIVGQLLLLAPEEDAFWIFVSIMDTHLRPYFSTNSTQMDVDAALFSRALESNDPPVVRKLFVDLGISPGAVTFPWFTSLFVSSLPPDYVNRVWDLFLYEGIPFLIRVALAIVACCRRQVLESSKEETLLALLRTPTPARLPPTADAFLSLALGVKLKDDDIRKQRLKMEAQVKRQTQVPRLNSTPGSISLPKP